MTLLSPSVCDPVKLVFNFGSDSKMDQIWIDKLSYDTPKLIKGRKEIDPQEVGYDLTIAREL